ncbi:hypothetical protein EN816_21520 [Mesorhizobium sp. M8A.F.Ca.ET.173.01.1.1]|nr:hypothetical protein EN816_21520 [Mesorhizobium sp. M8A.F.Ca.ET.173.01.1.1]
MPSSPNISFVLHDVARLHEGIHQNKLADRGAWLLYLTPQARPLLEIMRGNGRKTRDEAFAGHSSNARQHRLQTLSLIKSNLLAACTQPAVDREKAHG